MKQDIHPQYREVVFFDAGADYKLLTRSTVSTKETIDLDGKEYPCVRIDISSASHPFFTGQMKHIDAAGRVEKFQKKWGARKKAKATPETAEAGEQ